MKARCVFAAAAGKTVVPSPRTHAPGHGAANIANYEMIQNAYALSPVKPVRDGEPRYEDHPINGKPAQGWFDEWDVRQAAVAVGEFIEAL